MRYLLSILMLLISLNAFAYQVKATGMRVDFNPDQTLVNKVRVVFVNGIGNQLDDATKSADALDQAIGGVNDYDYSTFYNPTDGFLGDTGELGYQANLSNQAFQAIGVSNPATMTPAQKVQYYQTLGGYYNRAIDPTNKTAVRIEATKNRLIDLLIKWSQQGYSRIVLVPHSQGNFYVEAAYAQLLSLGRTDVTDKIKVVGVASVAATTPSDTYISNSADGMVFGAQVANAKVALTSPVYYKPLDPTDSYQDAYNDGINGLRKRLKATNLFHSFLQPYLGGLYSSPEKGGKSYRQIIVAYVQGVIATATKLTATNTLTNGTVTSIRWDVVGVRLPDDLTLKVLSPGVCNGGDMLTMTVAADKKSATATCQMMMSIGAFNLDLTSVKAPNMDTSQLTKHWPAIAGQLFPTGVDALGNALAAGSSDPHYTILLPNQPAVVVLNNVGTWIPDSATSMWIWETSSGLPVNVTRTFRTTVDLTGLDPNGTDLSYNYMN